MRLRALVRRAAGHAATRIECGPLVFESQTGQFELDGLPLRLTALEWRVLSALMLRKEAVIERLELMERVYEGDADVDSNSLEVIVGRLRRKIGAALIETVRGRGYRLTATAGAWGCCRPRCSAGCSACRCSPRSPRWWWPGWRSAACSSGS